MTLDDLEVALNTLGVNLSLRLVVDAPGNTLTPEIKAALKAHKPALLAQLATAETPATPEPIPSSQVQQANSWEHLARMRWGPAVDDPTPGIIIDKPDPIRRRLALESLGNGPGDADESGLDHYPTYLSREDGSSC